MVCFRAVLHKRILAWIKLSAILQMLNENFDISFQILVTFLPGSPVGNKSALVQEMALRRTGDTPLFEQMVTNIYQYVIRPQWVNVWNSLVYTKFT